MYAHEIQRDKYVMIRGLTERDRVRKLCDKYESFDNWQKNRVENATDENGYGIIVHKFKEYERKLPKEFEDMTVVKLFSGNYAIFSSHELEYTTIRPDHFENLSHIKKRLINPLVDWISNDGN